MLVAITMTALLGFAAFVTDFGMAYTNKRGLQNGADSAALAVAQEIALKGSPTATCSQLDTSWTANPATPALVTKYRDLNHDDATSSYDLSCVAGGNQLAVNVEMSQESPTFFGGIMGVDGISLSQSATAVVGPAQSVIGLRPFAMCKSLAQQVIANTSSNHMLLLDNTDFGCGGASGNWGMMDFNGGSNPTVETLEWILNGYNGPISIAPPVYIPGDPGAPSPGGLEDAMNTVLDREIVIPVYDLLSGSGDNAQFRVMGFLSMKVCAWKFNNKEGFGTCFAPALVPSPVPQNYLQVRYAGYIPLGDVANTCLLGNSACDLGTRVFKLAD